MLSEEMAKLKQSFSCVTYSGDQHTHVSIFEQDVLAKLKKVTLSVNNGNWISICPDKGRGKSAKMSPLLSSGTAHKHHCACDSVIFFVKNQKLTVIYIDLKSSKPTGYANQFKSTRQFVRYALALIEEFYAHKIAIIDERFVILYGGNQTAMLKTTTVARTKGLADSTPIKAYKREVINGSTIYLKELLS